MVAASLFRWPEGAMCILAGSDEADSLALAVLTDEAHDQNRESSILRRGLRPQTEGRKRPASLAGAGFADSLALAVLIKAGH